MARILVVDDDEYIRDLVSSGLRIADFEVATVPDGESALTEMNDSHVDLVVLDVGLPGMSGFDVCRTLRDSHHDVPVLFLTARDATEDRVSGFIHGGDDYLTKPFSLEELVGRVRAILRRSTLAASSDDASVLRYDDLTIDERTFVVARAGREMRLSPTEFNVLRFLVENAEQVLSKQQILNHVWNYDFDGNANIIENYISYLRKKVDADGPALIHTVRGFGYVLRRSQ